MAEGPERGFRRAPAAVENGAMGATGWEAGKSGILAVACLISGGVTMLGFCSGLTGSGVRRAACCAVSCFARLWGLTLAARLSAERNDSGVG